jgi:archaeosine synthase beta-subunit
MKKEVRLKDFDPEKVARTDVRIGHVDQKTVDRFVVHFRSNGCLWDKQAGGCTMCGFWSETAQFKRPITHQNFVNQFVDVLQTHELQKYPVLSLYNAGSLLAEPEIPFSAVEEIMGLVARKLPDLKRVIIESKVEYVDKEKLRTLKNILGNRTQLALAIGFESQDDTVRNLCINKGCSKKLFENCIEFTGSEGLHSIVYLILKPPFLTEREAIDEAVASTKYVSRVGVSEINYETMTVESDTFVNLLYTQGQYRLPWLWSVADILKQVRPIATPFLTPFRYIVDSIDTPKNCALCTGSMVERIYQRYCADFDVSHFENVTCPCKGRWQAELDRDDSRSIPERVLNVLALLREDPRNLVR